METYNHNDSNSSSNSRHLKLINLFINNKLDYFKQFTKAIIIIQKIFNNAKIYNFLKC